MRTPLQTIRNTALGWHKHDAAYVALVIAGGYEEAGDRGRFRTEPGHALFHASFEAHLDRFLPQGAVVLNLSLPERISFRPGLSEIPDLDAVVRTAEKSREGALELLLSSAHAVPRKAADWPDELAQDIIERPSLKLGLWSRQRGLAPWTVSRGFRQVFGVSPEAFRVRARARQAWELICVTDTSLASIAGQVGFADQAHMCRGVRQLTGSSPRSWKQPLNGFKTASRRRV